MTTVVDLSTNATVSTLRDFARVVGLADDRLIVLENDDQDGGTWLLSTGFTSPHKISPDTPVGALGVLPRHVPLAILPRITRFTATCNCCGRPGRRTSSAALQEYAANDATNGWGRLWIRGRGY